MANWKQKIDLHKILFDAANNYDLSHVEDDCPKDVKEALAKEVEKIDCLKHLGPQIRRARSIASVNRKLEIVFDIADYNLIWCGMPN